MLILQFIVYSCNCDLVLIDNPKLKTLCCFKVRVKEMKIIFLVPYLI